MTRRHDIDALRALAFALVILYHVGMYYVAGWHWHVKSPDAVAWLQWPMRLVNLWRMDLVFLVSGLAIGFLRRGQGRAGLLRQRSLRLLLPLGFGMAVIVPFQPYAQALANGSIGPGFGDFLLRYYTGGPWPRNAFDGAQPGVTWNHLWYLAYLWVYTVLLVLLLPVLESGPGRSLRDAFLGLRGAALVLLPVLPLALGSALLWPHFPPTRDLVGDAWLHAVYFTLFVYGWWIGVDAGWWEEVTRLRWSLLGTAVVALALYVALRAAGGPSFLPARWAADCYLWSTILCILGWTHRTLNRPWPWLAWANESVYPWYVLHQTVIIVLVSWLAPLGLRTGLEAALLVAGTVLGCWGVTAVVRRSAWLRPLFGLRRRGAAARATRPTGPARPRCPAPASPATPAGDSA
ncbi:MAG: inner rane protein [Ramlibacter sp.]|nr:inner rane protein [Ramlibacter sp.]